MKATIDAFASRVLRTGSAAAAAALALLAAGCAYQVEYAPAHLEAARRAPAEVAEGKALVLVAPDDAAYSFEGHPSSFTGGATTLKIPIGRIAQEAARLAYGDRFREGVDLLPSVPASTSGYRLVVRPRVIAYSFGYYQLKNLGFAVTPGVEASLQVELLDPEGAVAWSRRYDSGRVEGESWMLTGEPAERINRLTHRALYDLMDRSAADAIEEMKRNPAPRGADG